jgi:uncharacterized protein YacL
MPPAEVFAGSVVGTAGLLVGLVAGLPLVALVHSTVDYPVIAALAWILATLGTRLGVTKGRQIVKAAGMTRLLDPPDSPPPATALLVDTSAVLDRSLLALGKAGLLAGGIVAPRFVIDEAKSLLGAPDPVSSRRARSGLESLEALERYGVEVRVDDQEIPENEEVPEKVLVLAERLGLRVATCSRTLSEKATTLGVGTVDLRRLAGELSPDHPPGERLLVDLLGPGRQAGQAIGYLPEGDMVVVNDAAHLIGEEGVEVSVVSTRQTAQGLLVFARLSPRVAAAGSTET